MLYYENEEGELIVIVVCQKRKEKLKILMF